MLKFIQNTKKHSIHSHSAENWLKRARKSPKITIKTCYKIAKNEFVLLKKSFHIDTVIIGFSECLTLFLARTPKNTKSTFRLHSFLSFCSVKTSSKKENYQKSFLVFFSPKRKVFVLPEKK